MTGGIGRGEDVEETAVARRGPPATVLANGHDVQDGRREDGNDPVTVASRRTPYSTRQQWRYDCPCRPCNAAGARGCRGHCATPPTPNFDNDYIRMMQQMCLAVSIT